MPSVTRLPEHTQNIVHLRAGQAHVLPLFIGGHWRPGHSDPFASYNPANGAVLWEAAGASAEDVDAAVMAARKAFPFWAQLPFSARQKYVEAYRDLLERNKEQLAESIAEETGKILWDARGEVASMIGKVAISIKAYHERTGQHETAMPDGGKAVLQHRPHGVVGVFGSYNFPGHLPNGHIVPALLAGNTVILKPSNYTPRIAEQMVRLWQEAGLPDGVLNLVQGKRVAGVALAAHKGLDGLFFTGSPATGTLLHEQFSGQPQKILALEMGGNNPLIVEDVSDLTAAAYLTIQSAFITAGQRCTCARRLIVPEGKQGDAFLGILAAMTRKLTIGEYDDAPEPFMGCIISLAESEKLVAAEQNLIKKGAKPIVSMQRVKVDLPFVSPAILDVTAIENREDNEHFGPLLQVIRVPDFEAAIAEANNTSFGLSAGLISDDRKLYEQFALHVRAGIVNWNRPTTGASSAAPFGGVGLSGNHRPSAYYAADYCAYPVAGVISEHVCMPTTLLPGVSVS